MDPLLRYMPMMFLSRVGSALPPSSTVKSMHVCMRVICACGDFRFLRDGELLETLNFVWFVFLVHAISSSCVQDGTNALMAAASNGHLEAATSLVKAGAALDKQNSDGHSALMFAYNGRAQVWPRLCSCRVKCVNDVVPCKGASFSLLSRSGVTGEPPLVA